MTANSNSVFGWAPAIVTNLIFRAGLAIGLGLVPAPAWVQQQMELHLVLAFDVSASINDVEFDLQRRGTADALRTETVKTAIAEARGGIAISIVQWSSTTRQALGLDWVELHSIEDAELYAIKVNEMPRRLPGGGTMIHAGLEFAAKMFETAPGVARRQVIDLAGNGRSDDLEKMLATRDRLLSEGVVINALAIEEHRDDLTRYFLRELVGGPGAFVVTADEFSDFTEAMQIKLHREISGAVIGHYDGPSSKDRRLTLGPRTLLPYPSHIAAQP